MNIPFSTIEPFDHIGVPKVYTHPLYVSARIYRAVEEQRKNLQEVIFESGIYSPHFNIATMWHVARQAGAEKAWIDDAKPGAILLRFSVPGSNKLYQRWYPFDIPGVTEKQEVERHRRYG